MGAPRILAKPVVTLQVKSGTVSSLAMSKSICSARSSSGVSTVMMGWRELTSKRNSSCLFRWAAGGFAAGFATVVALAGDGGIVWLGGAAFRSFDKAERLV